MAFRTTLARLALLLVGLAAGNARGHPTTLISHDYEHDARGCPFQTCTVDAGEYVPVGQVGTVPDGAHDVCGVRFKVTRAGSLGGLLWSLGRTRGGSEIATGAIPAEEIIPLYDLLQGADFEPRKVAPGEKLYLSLQAERVPCKRNLLANREL